MIVKETRFDFPINCLRIVCAIVTMTVLLVLPTLSRAGLLYSVPEIRGTLTDSTTGAPIENAVLAVRWLKTVYGFFHPQTEVMKKIYVATDKKGAFRIPAYPNNTHIFSKFTSVVWVVRHPLYSTDELGIGREGLDELTHPKEDKAKKQTNVHEYAALGQSGEVIFNFSLVSLKDKFKDTPSIKNDFHGELYREFLHSGPSYFRIADYLSVPVNANAVFMEWDEIAGRFPNVEYVQRSLKLGKEKVAERRDWKGPPTDD